MPESRKRVSELEYIKKNFQNSSSTIIHVKFCFSQTKNFVLTFIIITINISLILRGITSEIFCALHENYTK